MAEVLTLGRFDAVVSCLASRSGAPKDAWAIDHDAQVVTLEAAEAAGVAQFVLLSAICVQKPLLEFQRAKLAFEARLQRSGLTYGPSCGRRPSSSRCRGRSRGCGRASRFSCSGTGRSRPASRSATTIWGGSSPPASSIRTRRTGPAHRRPGPALTAREQGELLFEAAGMEPRFRQVPVAMMDAIIGLASFPGAVQRTMGRPRGIRADGTVLRHGVDAGLGRGRGPLRRGGDAGVRGSDTLAQHYARMIAGEAEVDLREHAVF
jgi:divinyl chlorophyllide a 8-vinyl-reductase